MQTHLNSTNATKEQLVGLITILEDVPDPRVTCSVDHDLADILMIALYDSLRRREFLRYGRLR